MKKSLRDLIDDAPKEALRIIYEHREILESLGLTGEMDHLDMSRMLHEALGKADRNTIRPLLRLLCANHILRGLTTTLLYQDEGSRYLTAFWQGVLSCETWMNEDQLLSMYKERYKHEFAATIGKKRLSKEDEVVNRLTPLVRAELDRGVSLLKACKDALKRENYKAHRIVNALALNVVEPELSEAVEVADKLWGEGDQGSHIVMRDQMFETFFPPSRIALCQEGKKLIRKEIHNKVSNLSDKKYPERHFGNKGVKLEGNQD